MQITKIQHTDSPVRPEIRQNINQLKKFNTQNTNEIPFHPSKNCNTKQNTNKGVGE